MAHYSTPSRRKTLKTALTLVELLLYIGLISSALGLFLQLEVLNQRTLHRHISLWKVEKCRLFLQNFLFAQVKEAKQLYLSSDSSLELEVGQQNLSVFWKGQKLLLQVKDEPAQLLSLDPEVVVKNCHFLRRGQSFYYEFVLQVGPVEEKVHGQIVPLLGAWKK